MRALRVLEMELDDYDWPLDDIRKVSPDLHVLPKLLECAEQLEELTIYPGEEPTETKHYDFLESLVLVNSLQHLRDFGLSQFSLSGFDFLYKVLGRCGNTLHRFGITFCSIRNQSNDVEATQEFLQYVLRNLPNLEQLNFSSIYLETPSGTSPLCEISEQGPESIAHFLIHQSRESKDDINDHISHKLDRGMFLGAEYDSDMDDLDTESEDGFWFDDDYDSGLEEKTT